MIINTMVETKIYILFKRLNLSSPHNDLNPGINMQNAVDFLTKYSQLLTNPLNISIRPTNQ